MGDPHFVKQLNNGNWLIVDSLYHSVIEVNEQDEAVWLYGLIGGMPLNDPHCAARNDYEETLIVDSANHRLLIVSQDLEVLWECSFLPYEGQLVHLSWPRYADFLQNGNIFLIDGKLGVGFELKRNGQVTKIHRSMDMNVTFAMRKTRCIHMIGNEIVFISDNENSRILKVRYT
ncbi:hypothetical protein [Fervidibacillus albus]|uniref:Uncharacterized protein n=1 Tax=Fervidibacillus albus TaxID=2980026 RepID=A0A9E8RUX5_9BACI|nr:hypothetical protein [Fervidibacillus albus]WAA08821.1 hypothetical protein OE104_09380 [Fervidibacillus albus]